jgi:hypothetical protein
MFAFTQRRPSDGSGRRYFSARSAKKLASGGGR